MCDKKEEIFIVGKLRLNGEHTPCIEIVLDTADGRYEEEILLLKQVSNEDNNHYTKKIPCDYDVKELERLKRKEDGTKKRK